MTPRYRALQYGEMRTTGKSSVHHGTRALGDPLRSQELAGEVIGALKTSGTNTMFGLPGGGANLDVIGAAEAEGIRFVLAHSESAAVIMAGVYGELTRHPAAAVVTRGPGAASAVNGVAQCMLDRQPVVLIADTVSTADRARVSHQRLDQTRLFAGVTKWSGVVGHNHAGPTTQEAAGLAVRPPFGPVHLDFDPEASGDLVPAPVPIRTESADLQRALRSVRESKRPVVLAGVGALGAMSEVRALVEGTHIPVLTTYKAKGLVPESGGNAAGLVTGATIEGPIIDAADLVVAIGLDSVELIPAAWPYSAPVVSFAGWPEDSPYFHPQVEVIGDVAELVIELAQNMNDGWPAGFAIECRDEVRRSLAVGGEDATFVAPGRVIEAARLVSPPGTLATVDAGAHMLLAMPLWRAEQPGEVLVSSGLATMGFALPAAIAASLARPDQRVICFVGDGGVGMVLAELETLARLSLPVTVVVFNDSSLSLIQIKQRATGQGGRGAVGYGATDFATVGRGFGIPSYRVEEQQQLDDALAHAVDCDGPSLVDVVVDPSCYHQVLMATRGPRNQKMSET